MSYFQRGLASRRPGHLDRVQVLSVSGRTMVLDLRRLARLRREAYRLLAVSFLYPRKSLVPAATRAATLSEEQSPWAAQMAFYGPRSIFLDSALEA
jgi:hypothetical protein